MKKFGYLYRRYVERLTITRKNRVFSRAHDVENRLYHAFMKEMESNGFSPDMAKLTWDGMRSVAEDSVVLSDYMRHYS